MWLYFIILMFIVQVFSDGSSKVRVMTYNIRTASEWARLSGGDLRNMRTWDRRIKSVARTIMIAKPHVIGIQEGLGTQLDELENILSGEYKQYKGMGRLGGLQHDDDNEFVSLFYDAHVLDHMKGGTFWLSEKPSRKGSTSWQSSLPRCATWSIFRDRRTLNNFAVINTHFDHQSEIARANSAALLRMKVESVEKMCGGCPVFLVGDFNAPKDERWHRLLTIQDPNTLKTSNLKHDDMDISVVRNFTNSRLHFVDAWEVASTKSCGACGQSTYHAWRGSQVSNHLWLPFDSKPRHEEISLSGQRHVDAVLVASRSRGDVIVLKAKMLTDDRRIRYLGGPFASDHYPVYVSVQISREKSSNVSIKSSVGDRMEL